jgi:hypothetical protein
MVARRLTILVESDGKELFSSDKPGVAPLLELVERFPHGLDRAVVADRVVGGCAARVFESLQIGHVYALTGSKAARAILSTAGIGYEHEKEVAEIRNRSNTDACPFETLSRKLRDPRQLIAAMKRRLEEMRGSGPARTEDA